LEKKVDKVDSIVKTTQKNAMLGFIMALLIAVSVICSVVAYLYLDLKKVNQERLDALTNCTQDKKSLEAEFRAYLIQDNARKKGGIIETDSITTIVKSQNH